MHEPFEHERIHLGRFDLEYVPRGTAPQQLLLNVHHPAKVCDVALQRLPGSIGRFLDAGWQARYNRPPTKQELAGLVREHVREIALYRHAVAMGLDKNDPVIRRTLGKKLQTLTQNLVELSLSPSDQELSSYFQANAERYRPPDLITFTQVFVDPDKRGDRTLKDAEAAKIKLAAMKQPPRDARSFGDPFMLQSYYPQRSEVELAKQDEPRGEKGNHGPQAGYNTTISERAPDPEGLQCIAGGFNPRSGGKNVRKP